MSILKYLKLSILIGLLFVLESNSYSLVPVESLVLGNFSNKFSENGSDPLEFVFGREEAIANSTTEKFKKDLAVYRGFYEEGKNLVNSCKEKNSIRYSSEWDKQQVLRTIFSELQYLGLDLTTRAIPQYAKYFEFTNEEYSNLIEDLIGNYCSNNLTVISKKELKNNLLLKFTGENSFQLPSVKNNPLFPDNMSYYVPERKAREQEFKTTIKLFQSFCSWSGDSANPGLLVPLLKHGGVMAFVNRQFNSQGIDWNPKKNTLSLIETKKSVQVLCENLICRQTSLLNFNNKILLSIGSTSFNQDFKNLYCDTFQLLDYLPKLSDQRIAKVIREITFDDENFLSSQFIALITGYPDFLLGVEKFTEGEDLLRSSIDFTWTNWAKSQASNFTRELYFEEPLTLELIERKLVFNKFDGKLKIGFDVNLGEFDRINQQIGKIKMNFRIAITKAFIRYIRNAMSNLDPTKPEEKAQLMTRFKLQIDKDVSFAKERLIVPPWKGDLALLIANEITEQIMLQDEKFFKESDSGMRDIFVEINYSPFALKYISHQFNINEKEKENRMKAMTTH